VRKVLAVARKEFRQIGRDRRTLAIQLFFPMFLLVLYGYALNFDIRHVRIAVEDRDRSTESRDLISAFVNSGYFDLVASIADNQIQSVLDHNEARAVLVVPENFGRDLATGRSTAVQVLLNGDNANTATTVMGYSLTIVNTFAASRLLQQQPGAPAALPVSVVPRVWYNPELRSALFLVPGLIAYIAMIMAVISTSLSVVREKERGTMEQVRMAPIGPVSFVVGKTVPYFVLALAASLLVLLVAMALFGLPVRGSWLLLILATSLFLVGALGLGLFISTIATSQQFAFQISMLASFLPTLLLSGFVFPISSMPRVLQLITYVVSAKYFLTALRGIVLKGVGIGIIAPQLVALTLFALVVIALASVRLSREWS
jgi:ABC-2 type transport system permease protein